ncbi:hypothetical protein HID58_028464, partial [Brassica napus]
GFFFDFDNPAIVKAMGDKIRKSDLICELPDELVLKILRSRVEILQLKLNPCYEKPINKRLVNNAVARSLRELRF